MSSILRKVDKALNHDHSRHDHGPISTQHSAPEVASTQPRVGAGFGAPSASDSRTTYASAPGVRNPVPEHAVRRDLPGPAPHTAGPHRSDFLNKIDPRVDSDMSNPRTVANYAVTDPSTGPAPTTAGPHRSDMLNKLDPRVDSDLSAMRREGFGGQAMPASSAAGTGAAGRARASEGTYGPHSSRIANAADPRVDGDAGKHHAVANYAVADPSTGPAPTTAGPHRSDLLNKLDPRVDSDLSTIHREGFGARAMPPSTAAGTGAPGGVPGGTYGTHGTQPTNVDSRVDRGAMAYGNSATTGAPLGAARYPTGEQRVDGGQFSEGVPPAGKRMY